jgi:glutamine transport system substrate-binding protein
MKRLLLAGLAFCFAACSAPREPDFEAPERLIVGSDIDNAPFASLDTYGRPVGRDVEMMQAIADELGLVLEWKRMPFGELLGAVEEHRIDVVCATMGITEERAERVAFSRPYFDTSIALVVRVGADEPRSQAELAGRRVAAGKGTTSERAVTLKLVDSRGVFEEKSDLPAIERLRSRAVDAIAMDGPAADALVAQNPGVLVRLDPPLERERYALVLHRDRWVLRARLDAALEKLQNNGWLAALDRRYGLAK